MQDPANMSDDDAYAELAADNARRTGALIEQGLNPLQASAVIRGINEDTIWSMVLDRLGQATGEPDLLDKAKLAAAGKVSNWLDGAEKEAEAQSARDRLAVVRNGVSPRGR